MKRADKIERMQRAGWNVRYTSNTEKRICATRKGVEHRGSVNKVHQLVFGYWAFGYDDDNENDN